MYPKEKALITKGVGYDFHLGSYQINCSPLSHLLYFTLNTAQQSHDRRQDLSFLCVQVFRQPISLDT